MPSVAVNQLKVPTLRLAIAKGRRDQPTRGGSVDVGVAASAFSQQQSDPAPRLRRQLQPTRLHAGHPGRDRPRERDDHRADATTPQALRRRPEYVGGARAKDAESLGHHTCREHCWRVKRDVRIHPDKQAFSGRKLVRGLPVDDTAGQEKRGPCRRRISIGAAEHQLVYAAQSQALRQRRVPCRQTDRDGRHGGQTSRKSSKIMSRTKHDISLVKVRVKASADPSL